MLALMADASAMAAANADGFWDTKNGDFEDLDSLLAEDSFETADEMVDSGAPTFLGAATYVGEDEDEDFW